MFLSRFFLSQIKVQSAPHIYNTLPLKDEISTAESEMVLDISGDVIILYLVNSLMTVRDWEDYPANP